MDSQPGVAVEPIVFNGRLNEADVGDLLWYLTRVEVPRLKRWLVGGLATGMVVSGILLTRIMIERDTRLGAYFVVLLGIFLWCYLLVLTPGWQAWLARRSYRSDPAKFLESRVTLSADWVTIENEVSKSEFRWELVGLIVDTPAGLMFCNTARQALFWLPNRLFEDNNVRGQVLALGESKKVRLQRIA